MLCGKLLKILFAMLERNETTVSYININCLLARFCFSETELTQDAIDSFCNHLSPHGSNIPIVIEYRQCSSQRCLV